jgi:hypothetical protein
MWVLDLLFYLGVGVVKLVLRNYLLRAQPIWHDVSTSILDNLYSIHQWSGAGRLL